MNVNVELEDIIEEYKKALKKRNKTIAYNQKIKKKVRTTHTLFALFFLCLGYGIMKPQYVQGLHGEALEKQVQAEYVHLVKSGWNDIHDIQSYLQEYRENKQNSYVVLGNTVYRICEIPEILFNSKWGVIARPIFDVVTLISVFAKRGYASISSIILFLKDSGNGVIHIQNLGDIAATGIWVFFLHFLYWAFQWFRNTIQHIDIDNTVGTYNSFPILIRGDEENSHVVMFYDMVDIINHPLKRIQPPIIYAWIYRRLGIE